MRKNISVLVAVVLTLCLVGFTFDQFVPASTARAAGEAHPVVSSAGLTEKEAIPLARSTQWVIFVVVGLECILCGMFAVSPLLIDDPAQLLHEADRAES